MTPYSRFYGVAFAIVLFLSPIVSHAATLNLSPVRGAVDVGSMLTETVVVSSSDQAINAVSGTISFPSDLLQVVSVSKTNSILTLWMQEPTFSNTDGTISFSGIVPNPGYMGTRGQIFTIQFRGKKAGTAAIEFSSPQVLANDGSGTDVITGTQSATLTVSVVEQIQESVSAPLKTPTQTAVSPKKVDLLARITSSSHPDQEQWYKTSHAIFDWTNAQGVSAVRLGYDKNEDGKPNVLYSDPISHKEIDFEDGSWYFHVQQKSAAGWGPISTYKIQIDTIPPTPFSVEFPNGTTTPSGSILSAKFTAMDDLSGIDRYQISVDGKEVMVSADEGSRPYNISGDAGTHTLLVRAYDKAGNVAIADGKFFVESSASSVSKLSVFSLGWLAVNYLSLVLIVLSIAGTLLFAAWYIHTHFSAYRQQLNRRLGITNTHVHKEFDLLKDALNNEIRALERAKSKRDLTREEGRLVSRLKKLLEQSEKSIEKEIEDLPV